MNCTTHTEVQSEAFCTQCGRALCTECIRKVRDSVYCENCLEASIKSDGKSESRTTTGTAGQGTQTIGGDNPDAAFVLGLIPGVGAIYNGEYFKAAIHVLIFGMLTSLGAAMLAVAFYFYMPFEAYYTAKKRKLSLSGVQVVTPIDRFYEQFHEHTGGIQNREFWGGIGLIVLGALYLLNSFDLISFYGFRRFWPALLIAAGVALLLRSKEKKA
jgi:LiaI-LiaF-like transmembrane region